MLRVMVMAALADGRIDNLERAEIEKQYLELAGLPITADTLDSEISMAASSSGNLNSYVQTIVSDLSPHGKALVVRLALRVMSAEGEPRPGHKEQLAQLAGTLGIPQEQYLELIRQLSTPPSEA